MNRRAFLQRMTAAAASTLIGLRLAHGAPALPERRRVLLYQVPYKAPGGWGLHIMTAAEYEAMPRDHLRVVLAQKTVQAYKADAQRRQAASL